MAESSVLGQYNLLRKIFRCLTPSDVQTVACVNRQWNEVAEVTKRDPERVRRPEVFTFNYKYGLRGFQFDDFIIDHVQQTIGNIRQEKSFLGDSVASVAFIAKTNHGDEDPNPLTTSFRSFPTVSIVADAILVEEENQLKAIGSEGDSGASVAVFPAKGPDFQVQPFAIEEKAGTGIEKPNDLKAAIVLTSDTHLNSFQKLMVDLGKDVVAAGARSFYPDLNDEDFGRNRCNVGL